MPENAQYYAAFGAALYGLARGRRRRPLRRAPTASSSSSPTAARRASARRAGPPLVEATSESSTTSVELYKIPKFVAGDVRRPGRTCARVIGLDGGSTSSKAVLVDEDGEILGKAYQLSKGNPIQDTKELLAQLNESRRRARAPTLEVHRLRRDRLRRRRARGVRAAPT